MIRTPLRAGLALACALSLSACGGGDGDVYVGGTAYGVTKPGLVLTNNGGDDLAITQSGPFHFAKLVETDSAYNIKVKSVPPNVEKIEDCVVTNGIGKAVFTITNIVVNCKIRAHALGGNIYGLGLATGLVLSNGNDTKEITPTGAEPLAFSMTPVSEDVAYGIVVQKHPTGLTCTVDRATESGTMRDTDIANIAVRCNAN